MAKKQKLELTWIGKDKQPKLEPRILIEDPEKSYGDKNAENMLIHGDNLLALKALEQDFTGKIKCIYIDPPYNTGNAFDHYDDGLEHSIWLSLIKPRIEILHRLLSNDGSLWISIDDDESHYLKVLCDEIFGRKNFVNNVIWEKKFSPQNDAKWLSDSHDHILVYAKSKEIWRPNLLPRTAEMDSRYKNPDNDPRGVWTSSDLTVKTYTPNTDYPIKLPSGRVVNPTESRCWAVAKEKFEELVTDNRIWFGESGNNMPRLKRFLSEVQEGTVSKTIWFRTEVGDNQEAKREVKAFNSEEVFATPKPERLLQRILTLVSNENDWILDSFLGSGTTSAVAHKMKRKWIGIELGDHCNTHCLPRIKKVVDGTDQGGISKAENWQGGGGFKYYYLAPSLLKQDKYDNWIIDERYNADMLASAMAKHEGFKYSPDESVYWKQGRSTEKDYIFTTTNFVTVKELDRIHDDMKPDESLLICCKSFSKACIDRYANITVKKIPNMLLGRCEFGKEDYSLNIVSMPVDPDEAEFVPKGPEPTTPNPSLTKEGSYKSDNKKRNKKGEKKAPLLF
ncbi:modification methylase MboII [bacterium BMS3Abin06]|nr:modification methylase MboII [bacterium BMS3Abin06]HDZ03061.1 site-specific DNA-methyltransferase [Nitrospirota bacterium]